MTAMSSNDNRYAQDKHADATQSITVLRDMVYASPGGIALKADLYLPPGEAALRPAIIWLHGGGWRFGTRRLAPDLARYFAQRGYCMVSVDYRLSTQAVFPGAIEDVKTSVRWLKSIAHLHSIDPDRIGLWGSSAGGYLAAMTATSGPGRFEGQGYENFDSSVAAVVDAYGPTDFLQMDAHRDPEGKPSDDPESIQMPVGKLSADLDSMESLFIGAPIETRPDLVRLANPITYVSQGLPPFLILHGKADTAVPPHQSVLLYDALLQYGNDVTLGMVRKLGHGFTNRRDLDDVCREIEVSSTSPGTDRGGLVTAHIFEWTGDWFDRHLAVSDVPAHNT